jgi:hypothetical protein
MEEKNRLLKSKIKEKISLFEMANLTPGDTGLKQIVWIHSQTRKEKHYARIKLDYNKELIPIAVSDNPEVKGSKTAVPAKVLNPVKKWIVLNKDILLKYRDSNGKLSLKVVFENLKKV